MELYDSALVQIKVLDVNDNVPIFENPIMNVTIENDGNENTIIADMIAHDADAGLNSELVYSLADDAGGQFEINSLTGSIKRKVKIFKQIFVNLIFRKPSSLVPNIHVPIV